MPICFTNRREPSPISLNQRNRTPARIELPPALRNESVSRSPERRKRGLSQDRASALKAGEAEFRERRSRKAKKSKHQFLVDGSEGERLIQSVLGKVGLKQETDKKLVEKSGGLSKILKYSFFVEAC